MAMAKSNKAGNGYKQAAPKKAMLVSEQSKKGAMKSKQSAMAGKTMGKKAGKMVDRDDC